MKKKLLYFGVGLLTTFSLNAQITITQANLPTAGFGATEGQDTVSSSVMNSTPGAAGTNQTWNFSTWKNSIVINTNILATTSPLLTQKSKFPAATIGYLDVKSNTESYLKSSASAYEGLGVYANVPALGGSIAMYSTPPSKIISLPSTYNTNYTGNYTATGKAAFPSGGSFADSIKLNRVVNYTSTIDGWGNITTPSSTNLACIRQKYKEVSTTTIYIHSPQQGTWTPTGAPTTDSTFTYRWFSTTKNFPIAELQANGKGVTKSTKYLVSYGIGNSVDQPSVESKQIVTYPNPANTVLNISGITESSSILIYDVTGKLVTTSNLNKGTDHVNTSELENGIYLFQVLDSNKGVISTGKFSVSK